MWDISNIQVLNHLYLNFHLAFIMNSKWHCSIFLSHFMFILLCQIFTIRGYSWLCTWELFLVVHVEPWNKYLASNLDLLMKGRCSATWAISQLLIKFLNIVLRGQKIYLSSGVHVFYIWVPRFYSWHYTKSNTNIFSFSIR